MSNLPPVSVADAAATLGVDRTTVHRLVKRGDLLPLAKAPGLRGAYLFDPEAVATLAAQRATGADR